MCTKKGWYYGMAKVIISPAKYVQGAGELKNIAEYAVILGQETFYSDQ